MRLIINAARQPKQQVQRRLETRKLSIGFVVSLPVGYRADFDSPSFSDKPRVASPVHQPRMHELTVIVGQS